MSIVSFETRNIVKQFLREGDEVYVILLSQICSSYLRDYKAISVITNIKAFPNAIKNLVVSLL